MLCEECLLLHWPPESSGRKAQASASAASLPPAMRCLLWLGGERSLVYTPGRELHSIHLALTLSASEDDSILSPLPKQIQPAPPLEYIQDSPSPRFTISTAATWPTSHLDYYFEVHFPLCSQTAPISPRVKWGPE